MTEPRRNPAAFPAAFSRLAALLLAGVLLGLSSCEDAALFLDRLDDEVMLANDGYLEVRGVYPGQNSWFVNPGQDIQITFDKPVDPLAALRSIAIEDSVGNTVALAVGDVEFDPSTNTLTLKPNPYLEDSRQYTVTLDTSLTGRGLAPLRDEYSWSFTTGTYPKGYFVIHDDVGSTGTAAGYTNSVTVPLEIVTSNATDYFISSDAPTATSDTEKSGLSWTPLSGNIANLQGLTGDAELSGADGLVFNLTSSPQGMRYVYMMFKDSGGTGVVNYTPLEVGRTFLDTVPPDAQAGADAGPVRSAYSRKAGASDDGSGVDEGSYQWSVTGGTAGWDLSGETTSTATFTGPSGVDDMYGLTVSVADRAGNTDTDQFLLDWDKLRPASPSVTAVTAPLDNTPSWTWSPSGSSDAVGTYLRRLNGGTAYTTTATTYTVSSKAPLADGRHSLAVAQYDDAGNLSAYDYSYVVVNTAGVSPYPNEEGVGTLGTYLDWQPTVGALGYVYELYTIVKGAPVVVSSGSTGFNTQSPVVPLDSGTVYYWRYGVLLRFGNYTSPYYYFTTR